MVKSVLPATVKRVMLHTNKAANDRIYRNTISNIEKFSRKTRRKLLKASKNLTRSGILRGSWKVVHRLSP